MPLILPGNVGSATAATGYDVANSCRFDGATISDECLIKTFGTATSRKKFTYSVWVKLSGRGQGNNNALLVAGTSGQDEGTIKISPDVIDWSEYSASSASVTARLTTTQVFRDYSAWSHLVFVWDSGNATAGNRMRIYHNGSEITSFSTDTNPSEDQDAQVNNNVVHNIGRQSWNNSGEWNGYMAEACFIDGQALLPTAFGEFESDSGIWRPIDVSGLTFGNNGFYLEFKQSGTGTNASGIGADTSGNTNHFAVNNLTAVSQSTDTCTNNFATLNPLTNEDTDITISEGNLNYANSGSGDETIFASIGVSSGKWYFETKWIDTSNYMDIGVGSADEGDIGSPRADAEGTGYYMIQLRTASPGTRPFDNGSAGSGLGNSSANDINMFAIDMDNNKFYAGKNGTWYSSGDPANNSNPLITMDDGYTTLIPIVCGKSDSAVSVNFGSPSYAISSGNTDGNGYGNFEYAVPSGYYALNTKKPSGVWIMAYTTIDDPSAYFQTTLYTGNGGTLAVTNSGNSDLQPDWVWIKNRPDARDHQIYDSVRGTTKVIGSDRTSAEATVSNGLTAFGSNGFTVGSDANVNDSSDSHVAWQWKKSATAGFDIVSFTTSGDDENFSHSLGVKPELIIFKARASSGNWAVLGEFAETTFNNKYMVLNLTDAQGSDGSYSNPTASQFSTSNNVAVDSTHIAYLFRSVQGFSKIGSYTGNGNADGTFVYTGFKPAFTIIKRTDTANDWMVGDNKINPFNVTDNMLRANLNNVQQSGNYVDYLSNGFKLRLSGNAFNGSGGTYIYMAFAESPFVTSTGIPTTAR